MGETLELKENKSTKILEGALTKIIDEWYFSVSEYYVTKEKLEKDPSITQEEELKRFHDENGHRIKFAKGELDFTYGLKLVPENNSYQIQVSVNNKVEGFDYDLLARRLEDHYVRNKMAKPNDAGILKLIPYSEIFIVLDFSRSLTIEKREGKADVIRINFKVNDKHLKELTSNQRSLINFIQDYCVAPLKKIYADVYRRGRTSRF